MEGGFLVEDAVVFGVRKVRGVEIMVEPAVAWNLRYVG